MCGFSKPKAPAAIELPTPDPVPEPVITTQASPQVQDAAVTQKRDDERKRRRAASAANDTLVTGGQGVQNNAPTGGKQLFGQ